MNWVIEWLDIIVKVGTLLFIGLTYWRLSHVEHNTNSIMTQLVDATRKIAYRNGQAAEARAEDAREQKGQKDQASL